MSKKILVIWAVTILAVLGSLFFAGFTTYQLFREYFEVEEETKTVKERVIDLKEYKNEELGFKFEYPQELKSFYLEKQEVFGNPKFQYLGYFDYEEVEKKYYKRPFIVSLYSSDFMSYRGFTFNKMPVDVNWTTEEFSEKMGIPIDPSFSIPYVKKLDEKSLLLIHCTYMEGTPAFEINLLSPINEKYPNLQILIRDSIANDSLLGRQEYEIDFERECTNYSMSVFEGTASREIEKNIKTAQIIVNSIETFEETKRDEEKIEEEFVVKIKEENIEEIKEDKEKQEAGKIQKIEEVEEIKETEEMKKIYYDYENTSCLVSWSTVGEISCAYTISQGGAITNWAKMKKIGDNEGYPEQLYQAVRTSNSPFEISFDYMFTTETGVLDLLLNSAVITILEAKDHKIGAVSNFKMYILHDWLFDLENAVLKFRLLGKEGSEVLITNVQLSPVSYD